MAATQVPALADSFLLPWNNWMRALLSSSQINAAPQTLNQPILPWSFTGLVVNENNSSNPAAERAIVSQESYGRQLGRISDALAFLIDKTGADESQAALKAFLAMRKKIKGIKHETEDSRFESVLADLARLKAQKPDAFKERLARIDSLAKK